MPKKKRANKRKITWRDMELSKMTVMQVREAKALLMQAWEAEFPPQMVLDWTGLTQDDIELLKRADDELREFELTCRNALSAQARINIADEIRHGDGKWSKWHLEHKDPEYMTKQKIISENAVVVSVEEKQKAIAAALEAYKPTDSFEEE